MNHSASYNDGQLVITRLFDAPRQVVFDAWIKRSQVQLWWGCGIATDVQSDIEPKIGGKYSHNMMLKEVGEYRHNGLITEYNPPALLAYHLTDSHHDNVMQVRVEFIETRTTGANDIQTLVRLTQNNLPDEFSDFVMRGWTSGFNKLEELLNQFKYQDIQST